MSVLGYLAWFFDVVIGYDPKGSPVGLVSHPLNNMELRGGVEIPIALWGGLERRMGTMTRVLQAARYE